MRPLFKIVVAGHVDHGKSTLIGRLLYDTDSLPPGKVEELHAVSARRGMPLEWSFLLDAFQAERDQAVTIDTTQIRFRWALRDYVIIDAPGHREFLKNMISGAASADGALLVVDAAEGVREQSKRHGYLLHLLGIRQVAVIVNKMDVVAFDEKRFQAVAAEISTYLDSLGVSCAFVLPISGRDGDNVASRSGRMPWYRGPTVLQALDQLEPTPAALDQPLRFAIQDIYKFDARRILVGRVESGRLRVGDRLLFSPSNKTARVHSIEAWNTATPPLFAEAGESIGITLDEQIFVERGEIASHEDRAPKLTTVFAATVFWLAHTPLVPGRTYTVKVATRQGSVAVQSIESVVDTDTLAATAAHQVWRNGIARVVLRSREVLALDDHAALPRTGRCVLLDDTDVVAGGVISVERYPDQRPALAVRSAVLQTVEHHLSAATRARRNGHRGGVLWFTGLSGAGKSTLSMEVERRLFQRGYQVYVLDGDNVRRGLNANLAFSPEDRTENIRRVGEVAALFADAGFICITAFISPYRADRDRARGAVAHSTSGEHAFHEVFVRAGLEVCEARDPKGLYKKARRGEIAEFTGVSAPYEPPVSPELIVDTERNSIESCVQVVVEYVERAFSLHNPEN